MRCFLLAPLVLLARAVGRLPPWALRVFARVAWLLSWPMLGGRRRIAAANIDLCFPAWSAVARRRLLRANELQSWRGLFDLLRAWYAPTRALHELARIEGLEHLRAAMDAGQGVLLFTGHFTHTELAVRLLSEAVGLRVRGVVRRNNSACVERELERARASRSLPTLEKKDLRGLLRALQGGEVVAYSADQNFSYQHAFVPFFGVPAATLTSTAELVRRGRARMLPFSFHRDGNDRFVLRIEPTWPGWLEADPPQSAAIYMRELAAVVREHPEQYLWMHRRFKTRPPGQADPYR